MSLDLNELLSVNISLPSTMLDQKRIVSIFERIDQMTSKIRALTGFTSQLSHAIFIKMFGDSTINPMGWDTYSLDEIAEIRGGIQMCRIDDQCSILNHI